MSLSSHIWHLKRCLSRVVCHVMARKSTVHSDSPQKKPSLLSRRGLCLPACPRATHRRSPGLLTICSCAIGGSHEQARGPLEERRMAPDSVHQLHGPEAAPER